MKKKKLTSKLNDTLNFCKTLTMSVSGGFRARMLNMPSVNDIKVQFVNHDKTHTTKELILCNKHLFQKAEIRKLIEITFMIQNTCKLWHM